MCALGSVSFPRISLKGVRVVVLELSSSQLVIADQWATGVVGAPAGAGDQSVARKELSLRSRIIGRQDELLGVHM